MKICTRYSQSGTLTFTPNYIGECCPKRTPLVDQAVRRYASVSKLVDAIIRNREALQVLWQTGGGICADCPQLQGGATSYNKTKTLVFNNHSVCNAKCSYCFGDVWRDKKPPGYDLFPIIKELLKRDELHPNAQFIWNGGEPAIYPRKKDFEACMQLITEHGYENLINSNGIVFSEIIAAALENNPSAALRCSVDAGTRAVYLRLHRVDKFSQVWENLCKYAEACSPHQIVIKYIKLSENDNSKEYTKFLNEIEARGLSKSKIIVASDLRDNPKLSALSSEEMFARIADEKGIDISFLNYANNLPQRFRTPPEAKEFNA